MNEKFDVGENQQIFEQAGIVDIFLDDLTMEGLSEIGVRSFGDRLCIMKVLRKRGIVV